MNGVLRQEDHLLVVSFEVINSAVLRVRNLYADDLFKDYLGQVGETTASNGVKIISGREFFLGPVEGTSGRPAFIRGLDGCVRADSRVFGTPQRRQIYARELVSAVTEILERYKVQKNIRNGKSRILFQPKFTDTQSLSSMEFRRQLMG